MLFRSLQKHEHTLASPQPHAAMKWNPETVQLGACAEPWEYLRHLEVIGSTVHLRGSRPRLHSERQVGNDIPCFAQRGRWVSSMSNGDFK